MAFSVCLIQNILLFLEFIDQGGSLKDIPDDIRSENIVKLYYDCLIEYGNTLMADADRIMGVAL